MLDHRPQLSHATAPRDRGGQPSLSIVVSDLSSQGAGRWGGAVRPFLLGQALQSQGYGVEIVGFSTEAASQTVVNQLPITAIPVTSPYLGPQDVSALCRHLTGDMIYAYKLKPSSFGLALLHRLRHRRPVLLDIDDWELSWHGGDHYRYRPNPRQLARDLLKSTGALHHPDHPFYLQLIERLVAKADLVTTHNGFLQRRFGGTIIPNGKDTELFNPDRHDAQASRAAYGLSAYRVLMFPGAPRPYKGVEDLLQALDILNKPDLKLVIVGGSPYDDYDRTLLERWPQHIIHLGKQPYTDMPNVIAAAHVVVVPQRQTPAAQAQFPLKLTDGMAMAKPILATRVGDIPDILNGCGYLADADAPAQLAAQITQIFADYDRALDLGRQARDRCLTHYSMAAMGEGLHQAIHQTLLKSTPWRSTVP
ncbi:glycosyltransferase [Nodosilinea sp. LEGE 07088]|uniref:glycosyltransferase n=1 Tax=Nodosilinea sp. LEGE 07088 TaxID=2777968 RepID=UPI00188077D0|nr:glycosyltransferase [Nodosilinea sp. LEGE 07088]MBE9141049.1 glycosyltransferase [Nodosilinea sp. LEGE 07088]